MNHTSRRIEDSVSSTSNPTRGRVSRRQFLKQAAGVAAGLTLSRALAGSVAAAPRNKELPKPQKSGIEHVVVVMMENRSFDHLLGWLPGAVGQQSGLVYKDRNGVDHPTISLSGNYTGCGHPDPDHSYEGGHVEYNNGACDGWLRAGANDDYSIGYYGQNDLQFLGQAAQAWTTCDNYFASILAGTYPNRIYQHAAQTDRVDNSLTISTLPTIWDRLADHSISRRYYYSDFPFLAFWGSKYLDIAAPASEFFSACRSGTLPEVSFVEPRFAGEAQGLSNDYHPHSDIRKGELFLNTVYEAITSSPNWANTLLVINFDEWGGFFDHVRPTSAPIPAADAAAGSDGMRGFRVPALLVSPWSPRGTIAHDLYDHTSVLKLIEWRWNLRPLTVRDSQANNLAEALDFDAPNLTAPRFTVSSGPFDDLCLSTLSTLAVEEEFPIAFATRQGFPIPL